MISSIFRARNLRSPIKSANLTITAILLVAIGLWESAVRLGILDKSFFPAPTEIISVVPGMFGQPMVTNALRNTGVAMLYTIVYGIGLGIILGYAMGFSRVLRDAFLGPVLFLLAAPKSIFIPIFLLIFGIHQRTAIMYGIFSGFMYVIVNIVAGFDLIEQRHLNIGRAFGAGRLSQIRHIIFPPSLPGLFTGIWYGLKNGVDGILILELFISVTGLGQLMNAYSNDLKTANVYAIIFFFTIVSILLGSCWSMIERRLTKWRPNAISSSRKTVSV
jgi:ABC-type nitrate/sulfonate/bicarbonate transport system permease component